jgi:hypothetical protein
MPGTPTAGNVLASIPSKGTDESSAGVTGQSNTGPGVVGQSFGLVLPSQQGVAVDANDAEPSDGVRGITGGGSGHPNPSRAGVWGDSDSTNGVYGASATWNGVEGASWSPAHAGVAGQNNAGGPGVWGSSSGNAGQFDGNVLVTGKVTAQDVILSGADCAEEFDAPGAGDIEPGTVVVFDDVGGLNLSTRPYDKRVAGVISGAGSFRPGVVLDRRITSHARAPVALVGKVYCKVDASFGAIELGDMLTTSASKGCAMKVQDPSLAFGATIGKALMSLKAGRGLIPILVMMA